MYRGDELSTDADSLPCVENLRSELRQARRHRHGIVAAVWRR